MADYKPFLIQKLTENAPIKDSKDWNIWIKSVPFKIFPEIKDVPSRSWFDEHGDEDYVPSKPFYKAYEISCDFVYIGNHGTANTHIEAFLTYLADDGSFKFYDTYTQIGRTNVRYINYNEDVLYRKENDTDKVIFSVTLKVNDPITKITLTK